MAKVAISHLRKLRFKKLFNSLSILEEVKMKHVVLTLALSVVGLWVLDSADAGCCGKRGGFLSKLRDRAKSTCCEEETSCCAPEPSCCAPEPSCAAPEPSCAAPEPTCCAPEPTCCAPEPTCCEDTCCKKKRRTRCKRERRGLFNRSKSSCCESSCGGCSGGCGGAVEIHEASPSDVPVPEAPAGDVPPMPEPAA